MPREAYSLPSLLYSECCGIWCATKLKLTACGIECKNTLFHCNRTLR